MADLAQGAMATRKPAWTMKVQCRHCGEKLVSVTTRVGSSLAAEGHFVETSVGSSRTGLSVGSGRCVDGVAEMVEAFDGCRDVADIWAEGQTVFYTQCKCPRGRQIATHSAKRVRDKVDGAVATRAYSIRL